MESVHCLDCGELGEIVQGMSEVNEKFKVCQTRFDITQSGCVCVELQELQCQSRTIGRSLELLQHRTVRANDIYL